MRLARAAIGLWVVGALLQGGALAHDAGVQNGVFRSRDGGATWLQLNSDSFARGVLALAVHPGDPHHLLLATETGLLTSRNGGRDWEPDAQNVLAGPAFAVAFSADGKVALASGANALCRFEGDRWREARTPAGSVPARALVAGVGGRAYLAGWSGLHRSDDWGRSWTRVGEEIGAEPVTALTVSATRPDELHALAGGRVWSSADGARHWRMDDGAPPRVDALSFDRAVPTRLWLVAAGRTYRKESGKPDAAARWEPVGTPIPDPPAKPRAIHAMGEALLVATDRGVFRSADAGASWALLSAELPEHSETALVRDPHDPATVYAGFSRMGPEQLNFASPTQQTVASRDVALLVGAYAGFALLLVVVGMVVRRMTREDATTTTDHSIPTRAESR